jgi:UDP-N-acetylmuramyl tripeptide synthase
VGFEQIIAALHHLRAAPGRLEPVLSDSSEPLPGPLTLIDSAHKPDALEKALQACRPLADQRGGRLFAMFGCGGDRDRGKRPIMGEIGARMADRVILTSDNPRSEVAELILDEIYQGVPVELRAKVERLSDRRAAIEAILRDATDQDVVLIAGKGHEEYQDIAGVKLPFSDIGEARLALAARSQVSSC